MPMSDILQVLITTASAKVAQAGFGVPLILSPNAAWAERTRVYSDLDGLALDFATTTPEYLMAQRILQQEPRPEKIMVGRMANKPNQIYMIKVRTVANSTTYQVKVRANTASFTSDASATNDEIVAGLVSAINLLSGDSTTASAVGSLGAQEVQLLGNVAGDWDAVEVVDRNLLEVRQTHGDPGCVADLAAIAAENNSFYCVLSLFNSKLMVEAIAGWVESNNKMFVFQTVDGPTVNTGASGTDDVAESLQSLGYARSFGIYHPNSGAFADAAWAGRCLPLDPGSETWKFKTLVGVPSYALTANEKANADAKNLNVYETVAGVSITTEGKLAGGEFIDVTRFRDWFAARTSEELFGILVANPKVAYTDEGVTLLENGVKRWLREGVRVGGFKANPEPKTIVGKVADQPTADRSARVYRGLKFEAELAGAIHKAVLSGRVSI